jgi:hypothetical protein
MNADDPYKLNTAALKWLYELELVQSPTLVQNLYENIFLCHPGIKNCELLITNPAHPNKGVLVYLEFTLWTKLFKKTEALFAVEQTIRALLPSYRFRLVEDYNILQMAKKLNQEISNGIFKKSTNTSSNDSVN